ncbi:zinc finger domain-containing protein [Microlunatus sp. Y2014]|uniref:zinc finger domain-containing protein n=1 Tax=Microlunatus sp. Y2014 TaxID=3418488 RepID=UPI003DA76AD1
MLDWECESSACSIASRLAIRLAVHRCINRAESGYFERGLAAYGRAGEPCLRCGRPLVREEFTNRSSFRCPSCQRRPRRSA